MKKRLIYLVCSFFAITGILFAPQTAFANPVPTPDTTITAPTDQTAPETEEAEENAATEDEDAAEEGNTCYDQVGSGIGWLVCPTTSFLAKGIDFIYGAISSLLEVNSVSTDHDSPIYLIWEYIRNITNILFIIFLIVIIYSQLTGFGITNYGIKKALPRIIIAAILVNLSFIICALAVDVSNILGGSLRSVFISIQEAAIANGAINPIAHISAGELVGVILGTATVGGAAAIGGLAITGGAGAALWMILPVILAGIVSVVAALITLAARQALIMILIMIAPLAFVAYLLPNTEKWFKKWKDILLQMLVFYPMFSVLFGASQLAGWAILTSATNWFGVILGIAVQILPLFFSVSLMKMSNTVLGSISTGIQKLTAPAQKGVKSWSDSRATASKAKHIANNRTPSARLSNYLLYRKTLRETDTENAETATKSRAAVRAQYKISGGFDANNPDKTLRANRYTRRAKRASTAGTIRQTAETDTKNVISGQYGDYFHTKRDQKLSATSADAWLHFNRAQMTSVSNDEADFNYLVDQYVNAFQSGYDSYKYKKWIQSSTGSLGKLGVTGVVGQLLAQANNVEQRQRRDALIMFNKFGFQKRPFRSMMAGFYINDDGFATQDDGKTLITFRDPNTGQERPELVPGELLSVDPNKLVRWKTVDENGDPYFDMKDQQGNFIMRFYRKDKPLVKEAFSSQDIIINDHINDLYTILTGVYDHKEGAEPIIRENGQKIEFGKYGKGIGLADYSTTIARAMQSANYKEKASWAGSMGLTSASNRQIQNHTHLAIEKLDNINKIGKAGNFNTQDYINILELTDIINPDTWDSIFLANNGENLRSRVNVNGEHLIGLTEDGQDITIEQGASNADLMRRVRKKFIDPFAKQIPFFLSKITPQMADSQKASTAGSLEKLIDEVNKHYSPNAKKALPYSHKNEKGESNQHLNAYSQNSSFPDLVQNVKHLLSDAKNRKKNNPQKEPAAPQPTDDATSFSEKISNLNNYFGHGETIDNIVASICAELDTDPRFTNILMELDTYVFNNPGISEEDLRQELQNITNAHLSD